MTSNERGFQQPLSTDKLDGAVSTGRTVHNFQLGSQEEVHSPVHMDGMPGDIKESETSQRLYANRSNESSTDSKKSLDGNMDESKDVSSMKPNNPASSPVCRNCYTSTTPLWRRDEHGSVLCNACGLFLKLHGRPRPISLKTDVIKSRNRKSSHHDSPNDKKRKDFCGMASANGGQKKKKTGEPLQQVQQQQSMPVQGSQMQVADPSDDPKYHKILPKNSQSKGNCLPHLSSLLSGSPAMPKVEFPVSMSQPGTNVTNSPQMAPLQRIPSHMATINEILNINRSQQPHSSVSYSQPHVGNQTDTVLQSPIVSSTNNTTEPLAQVIANHEQSIPSTAPQSQPQSQQSQPQSQQSHQIQQFPQDRKPPHFSTSPPPMDLQQNMPNSNSSSSSNTHFRHHSSHTLLPDRSHSSSNIMSNNDIGLNASHPISPMTKQENKPSLTMVLQSQEEVIKLKTRINELELVTDLYKRHVFELDSKCKSLEQELLALKSFQTNQHQQRDS